MCIGICMKAVNSITFSSKTDFLFEFLPQIIMMVSLFGYMNLLIIIKWLTDYTGKEYTAPSIINTMINIPLKSGTINGQPFIGDIDTNKTISLILLAISGICVPLMLFPKPFILNSSHSAEGDEIKDLTEQFDNELKSQQEEN